MHHALRIAAAATLTFALAVPATAATDPAARNRTLASVHEPTVSRTDYVLDLAGGPQGLAPSEAARLTGWFDGLALGYGDTVSVDMAVAGPRGTDAVGAVLARFGMLLSRDPIPEAAGHGAPGTVRVVVSRAIARVDGCPDWSRGNWSEYGGAQLSNYGCATAQNLAAMVANPDDLVHGTRRGPGGGDARVSVKAIGSWRDAKNTGDAGLPGGISSVSVVKTGGN